MPQDTASPGNPATARRQPVRSRNSRAGSNEFGACVQSDPRSAGHLRLRRQHEPNNDGETTMTKRSKVVIGTAAALVVLSLAACSMMMGTGAEKPAPSEFGFGPRSSIHGTYSATLDPMQQIRV